MRVEVRVGEDEAELRSLCRWLRADDELRSAFIGLPSTATAPGEMGSALDIVEVVLDNVWSAASLVVAVAAWRQSRPHAGRTTLRVAQTEVEVIGDDEEQVRRVVAALRAATEERQPPAPAPGAIDDMST
ncbi:effector-associated constant component EACC1 [Streptomyces massasporeus]|uniref:effector-associated constant component EACC1 n=1 Tax=Streptomyces massasporeus TaxID=67324 RepID=UPI0033DF4C2E